MRTNNIRLPDRWRHLGSVGLGVRKLSLVCLHNNAIVARCILDTNIALLDTRTASAPFILLVLLEPHLVSVWPLVFVQESRRGSSMPASEEVKRLVLRVKQDFQVEVNRLKDHIDKEKQRLLLFMVTE